MLRALAFALDIPPAASAADRRLLWQRVGVSTDEISGTVITYGLRPPGADRWSAMMRERAGLGLITHLTVHELQRAADLTRPGEVIHVCENPQVLQRLAAAAVDRPVACTSGNPAAAGMLLLARSPRITTSDNHGQPGPATSQPSAPPSAGTRAAPVPRSLFSHGAGVALLLLRHDHGSPARYAGRTPPCDLARDPPERIGSAATSGRKGGRMEYQNRAAGRPDHYAGWAGSPVIPDRGPAGPDGPCSAGAVDDT